MACTWPEYATRVRPGLTLRDLGPDQFLANLDACIAVYAAAMNPPAEQLPGRLTIMERHAGYAAFRAVAAIALPVDGGPAHGGTGSSGTGDGGTGDGGAGPR